jgi:hypothetical protein
VVVAELGALVALALFVAVVFDWTVVAGAVVAAV